MQTHVHFYSNVAELADSVSFFLSYAALKFTKGRITYAVNKLSTLCQHHVDQEVLIHYEWQEIFKSQNKTMISRVKRRSIKEYQWYTQWYCYVTIDNSI